MTKLGDSLSDISGIGPKFLVRLEKLNIRTVGDCFGTSLFAMKIFSNL